MVITPDFGSSNVGSIPAEGTKKKYADLLAYINYNTYLCNIKLKQHDRYIWR